ncbi:MAG: Hsp20/alpha crystallin family protein [Candidatus Electrothrix sp. GW3-4]|uniref:Hsp20/alpha crystallin family protein n=1 Tax=Candidatus Electrothrix sp. GW3-4 TaxID=3126740 RepID=UPI0030CCB729
MSLSIWDPFREMEALLDRYSKSPGKLSGGNGKPEGGGWMPVVDIEETDGAFIVHAELPGVAKDDVQVNIENGVLTIKGEKKTRSEDTKRHRVECVYGSFLRSFTLPQDVDVEQVEAAYKNGILDLTIPKQEQAKPKQIEVKVQ